MKSRSGRKKGKHGLGHVQTVLSDLREIRVIDRPEDRHAYLLLRYDTNPDGATDIVRGSDHPVLADWQGSINMNVLFAKGVIG